jgi:hypothetical protein
VARELAIALRARVTWLIAALAALLVGHGFVLAVDLYSAASRSALSSLLQTREMDPLAGVVRPTLGSLDFTLSLLGPLLAARAVSVEKERGTYGALCLAVGSSSVVMLQKALAGACALGTLLVTPLLLLVLFRVLGGHVDVPETGVALLGVLLHLLLVTAMGVAAAAWTRTLAQAVTLGILASVTSWAIDAAEGFAALSWLGGASGWSIEQRLLPFQRGIIALGSILWLATATLAALGLALLGGSFARPRQKVVGCALLVVMAAGGLSAAGVVRRGFDWSEERRMSLPSPVVEALRAIPDAITIEVFLDRDDSRRRQLSSDALSKLVLARPDITVRTPLDESSATTDAGHDVDYGRLVLHVGSEVRQTRSTSRRELVTLLLEAAGRPVPSWSQSAYPGFPVVLDGALRRWLGFLAYAALPLGFAALGFALTRRRTIR